MAIHEIDLIGLQEWLNDNEALYASSSRERKRFVCTMNGSFRVTVAGKIVYEGDNPTDAIKAYNDITEPYISDALKNFRL